MIEKLKSKDIIELKNAFEIIINNVPKCINNGSIISVVGKITLGIMEPILL